MALHQQRRTALDKTRLSSRLKCLSTSTCVDRIIDSLHTSACLPNPGTDYLRFHVLSKYVEGSGDHLRLREQALKKLEESEDHCKKLNETRPWARSGILDSVRTIVKEVLGPFSYKRVLHYTRFSGGASTVMGRTASTPQDKYDNRNPDVTPTCLKYALALFENTAWGDTLDKPLLIRGNRVTTVPKNDKTDRAIAIEPTLNMYFQLGVGGYIRKRLKTVAFCAPTGPLTIDLNNQTINRELARIGSLTGSFATIDLSSASDNISWMLVYDLLPEDWFKYLDDIRSHYRIGAEEPWQKFSAMGNGFTFELESLIFFAVVKAAQEKLTDEWFVSVYGDDIICPDPLTDAVKTSLRAFGFKVNEDKTFSSPSAIRESCGGHYFHGHDITPFYIRKPLHNLDAYCKLLNDIRGFGSVTLNGRRIADPRLYDVWLSLFRAGGQDVKRLRLNAIDLHDKGILVPYRVEPSHLLSKTRRTDIELPSTGSYLQSLASSVSPELFCVPSWFRGDPDLLYVITTDIKSVHSNVKLTPNCFRTVVYETCSVRYASRATKTLNASSDLYEIPIFPQELEIAPSDA